MQPLVLARPRNHFFLGWLRWLLTNDHVRPCKLKLQQRDFAPVLPRRLSRLWNVGPNLGTAKFCASGIGLSALGGVDSKDSLLGANQIQGCFLGGSLGCDGPVGVERRGVGADGAADHRSTGPEGLHRARQPDVRGRCAVDRAYGFSLA